MRIGFANGVFDLLHEGHIHFLERCAQGCDYLILAVNDDESVKRLKGPQRPVRDLFWRLRELQCRASYLVDAAIPFDGYEEGLIVHIRPHIVFRGYDQGIDPTRGTAQVAKGLGCEVVRIPHLPGFSTTLLLEDRNRTTEPS